MLNSLQVFFSLSMSPVPGWRWKAKAYLELPSGGSGLERPVLSFQVQQFWFWANLFYVEGVWRHTCLSVDFSTGRLLLVENGHLLKEIVSEELVQMFKVNIGLFHPNTNLNSNLADFWRNNEQRHCGMQLPQGDTTVNSLHEHAGAPQVFNVLL